MTRSRECLVLFAGGPDSGYTLVKNGDGTIRVGYLNADGTEPDMRTAEWGWARADDLTATGRLPDPDPDSPSWDDPDAPIDYQDECTAEGFSQYTVYLHTPTETRKPRP